MFCPKCGEVMQDLPGRRLTCERGQMELSQDLERRLRDCYVEGRRRPRESALAFTVSGKWYCPGCGVPTQENRRGEVQCPQCSKSLQEFIPALVEMHPHK